ncbi:MAG: vitamin B12/cobalamin outer membrane transporter [Syntrophorhabdus sp. PtaU1.Bin002]|nr:MAG: vitamin B12/cobalamin outer membrane transporter [Syntrophorhabdus sp. PtaB.Bin006]OPY70974.1 MAG: vitamin B12/cobalamin outer membrane transporter [Syntrophorhabdus sp. PtaU1.Bin002]
MEDVKGKILTLLFVLLFGTCCLTPTAVAQQATEQKKAEQKKAEQKKEKQDPYSLEEITVKGKAVGEPVASPYAVPASSAIATEIITREDIEALHPKTVWDVLEQVPGMEITYQGRQHMDFSNMRGTGSYGLILDGVYVSSLDRLLSTLPVDAIESMIIVRDATALTLGPLTNFGSSTGSSNQGFVIIKTKRASKLEGGLVASYGSFHTEKAHVYQGAKIGNFDYRLAGTHDSSLGKTGWYNGSRNNSLLFRGGYTGSTFNGDVLFYTSRGMREFERGEILVPTTRTRRVGGRTVSYLDWSRVGTLDNAKWKIDPMISNMIAVNLNKSWSDTQTTTFSYAYNSLQVTSVQDSFIPGSRVTESDQDSRGQSAGLRHVINSHGNILKLGGQYLEYVSPDGLAPNIGKRVDEEMYSLYVQDEYHMLNDRLTFDGGIRMDKKHYDNSPVTGQPTDEWAKETYTYGVGASYKLNPIITLTGRYAYSENSLSSYQVSPDGGSLPSEKRSRYEAGILANIHPFFNPSLTLYYYDTKDQKVSTTGIDPFTGNVVSSYIDPATGEEVDFVTTSDVRTKGFEFGVSGQILKPLTYRLQYSYVETDDHDTNRSISHHLVSGRVSYKYKNFDANVSGRYVGPKSRSSSPMGVVYYELGDYTRIDANVAYNCKLFDRDTKITVYGRNLTNTAYATRYVTGAYWDPGIQYGVELSYKFW